LPREKFSNLFGETLNKIDS